MNYSWKITPGSSAIEFRMVYYHVGNISGSFLKFNGTVYSDADFTNSIISLVIETSSVSTLDRHWDKRLLKEDFLDATRYPVITFTADAGCVLRSGSIQELSGWLSIRDQRQMVTMIVTSSFIKEHLGVPTVIFMLTGTFSLKEFGYHLAGDVIGDQVSLNVRIKMTGRKNLS